jgi:hypothetical protein
MQRKSGNQLCGRADYLPRAPVGSGVSRIPGRRAPCRGSCARAASMAGTRTCSGNEAAAGLERCCRISRSPVAPLPGAGERPPCCNACIPAEVVVSPRP